MLNFRLGKICLSLLSIILLAQNAFAYENDRFSYLNQGSNNYLYDKIHSGAYILDKNSPEAKQAETTLKLDVNATITEVDEIVNLSLREADLKQTLRMLANKAKINIVFDPSVEGKLTLDLNNVSLNEAFMIVFKTSQLTYSMEKNTLSVATIEAAKKLAYQRKNMTVIPIKYVNATKVANFLNANLFNSNIFGLTNGDIVTVNSGDNQIIAFGTDEDIRAIKRVLPSIDKKPMVNVFKVKHTTPKEMAVLICETLITGEQAAEGADTGDVGGTDEEEDSESMKALSLGKGNIVCRSTAKAEESEGSDSLKPFNANDLTVTYFPDQGQITVYGGSTEQVEIIKEFIEKHDKKQLMAYIELSVLELNESGSKSFTNQWGLWTPFVTLTYGNGSFTTTDMGLWNPNGHNPLMLNKAENAKHLKYSLTYLLENGNGRVLTNPKIMVTNGRKATVDMTSDYVKSVQSQIVEGSNGLTSGTQRTYEIGDDNGLLIDIMAFISPDGYVSLDITPEFATIKQEITGPEGLTDATLLQRRDLQLKSVRIKDGETLVLAGLIEEDEKQTVKKVPILSDLPLVGALFRDTSNSKSRKELVILVTPHIIKDTEEIANNGMYDL